MEALARVRDFSGDVFEELKKVTWPDRAQLKNATFVVVIFVLIVAAVIWGMDVGVRTVLDLIMHPFAG